MEQAIPITDVKPEHTVENVAHITGTIEVPQRLNYIDELEDDHRISSVSFCTKRRHLLLVKYDRNRYSSQDVLAGIKARKMPAVLVGPV